MSAQEYISSGAIEACVMGLATEEEWLELEQMAAQYPEVMEAKQKAEADLESSHLSHAIPPPSFLKDKIFTSLEFDKKEAVTDEAKVVDMQPPANNSGARPTVVPIIPTPKSVKWLRGAVAVAVLLLMGSILLNFHFYGKSVSAKKEYDQLVLQQNSLQVKNKAMQASFDLIKNPAMKQVTMGATPTQPGSLATVYWDNRSKDVYLMVNSLPAPAAGKQYQLWAIVDGKPVDAGMVAYNEAGLLLKMHNMPAAQAFAITLEKEGGSPSPTMEAMYVYGGV